LLTFDQKVVTNDTSKNKVYFEEVICMSVGFVHCRHHSQCDATLEEKKYKSMAFYVVVKGRKRGIFRSW
jgi:hypothetical protein